MGCPDVCVQKSAGLFLVLNNLFSSQAGDAEHAGRHKAKPEPHGIVPHAACTLEHQGNSAQESLVLHAGAIALLYQEDARCCCANASHDTHVISASMRTVLEPSFRKL